MTVERKSTLAIAVGALVASLVILAGAAMPAEGARLGKTARSPAPSCPKTPCQAVGRTTVIQLIADGKRAPFKARKSGKLVAWAIDLSRPNKSQSDFFGEFYSSEALGMRPAARISVLKRKGDGRSYRLKGQSEVVDLTSALGSYQVFTLSKPLAIRKGEFLGITFPTWAPAFSIELNRTSNIWRASRTEANGPCDSERTIEEGKPQQNVGSTRSYGCDYSTARVLYWGFYDPTRKGE